MNKMIVIVMVLIALVLFVSGCVQNDPDALNEVMKPIVQDEIETQVDNSGAGDMNNDDISKDIAEIESTSSELEDGDVENLDEEFENIDW